MSSEQVMHTMDLGVRLSPAQYLLRSSLYSIPTRTVRYACHADNKVWSLGWLQQHTAPERWIHLPGSNGCVAAIHSASGRHKHHTGRHPCCTLRDRLTHHRNVVMQVMDNPAGTSTRPLAWMTSPLHNHRLHAAGCEMAIEVPPYFYSEDAYIQAMGVHSDL